MNTWLTIRMFTAVLLGALGLGLMFGRSEDNRVMLGALLFAVGLTFLLRMAIEFRQR